MATTLPDTAIAAANDGANINVYFQQTDGSIVEHTWRQRKDKKWKWQASSKLPLAAGVAKFFTPLAANIKEVDDDDDSVEWHVYYLNNSNYLCEVYHRNGTWTQGTLNSKSWIAAPYSKLSIYSDTIYYQATSGQIWSATRGTSGWTQAVKAMTTKVPLLGTSLAAVQGSVIDQGSGYAVESNDGTSVATTDVSLASPHSALDAVGDGDYQAIFYMSNASKLKQWFKKASTKESNTTEISNMLPKSDIAAVRDKPSDDDPDVLHVFFQKDSGDKVWEYKYTEAKGWKDQGAI
jgi:hypothetical protein